MGQKMYVRGSLIIPEAEMSVFWKLLVVAFASAFTFSLIGSGWFGVVCHQEDGMLASVLLSVLTGAPTLATWVVFKERRVYVGLGAKIASGISLALFLVMYITAELFVH